MTESQRSQLVERYRAGESSNALAAEFGIDRRTAAIFKRAGAETRYRVELTEAEVDVARELYESGHSLVMVGEKLGVSSGTIRNLLRQAGVQTRAVGRTNGLSAPVARSPSS